MALFRFRMRSPDRDRQSDLARMNRIRSVLDEVRGEIEREQEGFTRRYEATAADAAFQLESMESDGAASEETAAIDEKTETLKKYMARMAFLEKQIAMIHSVEEVVSQFSGENGLRISRDENR